MICPFRVDILFDHTVVNNTPICRIQREVYPECMEEECPFYEDNFAGDGSCKRVREVESYG